MGSTRDAGQHTGSHQREVEAGKWWQPPLVHMACCHTRRLACQCSQQSAQLLSARPCQVLELCSGGELVAATKKRYSERTAASFLRAVLRTVAQCHAKRIIHRDIKPENVGCLFEAAQRCAAPRCCCVTRCGRAGMDSCVLSVSALP